MYFSQKAASSTDGKRMRVSESVPFAAVQSLSTVIVPSSTIRRTFSC